MEEGLGPKKTPCIPASRHRSSLPQPGASGGGGGEGTKHHVIALALL